MSQHCYKIGSALGDLARLEADVFGARSREARLSPGVCEVRCVKCIFNVQYFQLMMGVLGCNPIVSQRRSGLWFTPCLLPGRICDGL